MSFYLGMIVTNATITGLHSVNHIFAKAYDDVKGITGVALPARSNKAAKPGFALLPPAIVANNTIGFLILSK